MKTIIFTAKANPISDFDVENAYEEMKFKDNILISNQTLLYRFRVGVKKKEIPVFKLIVEDLDGKIYEAIISKNGVFNGNLYSSKILSLDESYLLDLI